MGRAGRDPRRDVPARRTTTRSSSSSRCSGKTSQGREYHRAQDDAGSPRHRRTASGRRSSTVSTHPRPRVDLRPRSTAGCSTGTSTGGGANDRRSGSCLQTTRALVRARRTTRTATSTRSTSSGSGGRTSATTTATAIIERRRRRPEPELRRALGLRRGGLVLAFCERDLPRPRAGLRARDARPSKHLINRIELRVLRSATTRSGRCSCTRRAGRCRRRRRTTRSTSRYTGTDDEPGRPGLRPRRRRPTSTRRTASSRLVPRRDGARSRWTPELDEGCDGCGFVFPDDEALVQAEFEKNLDVRARRRPVRPGPGRPGVAPRASTPRTSTSTCRKIDPWKSDNPTSDLTVDVSYAAAPQAVEVLAKRSAGRVRAQVLDQRRTRPQTATTMRVAGRRALGGNNACDVYYHYRPG